MSKWKKRRRRKWRSGLKAGCLALGMATAWGGEAHANVISYVSITPETNLNNAFVYYNNNFTSGDMRSLGDVPGGQTTVISHADLMFEDIEAYAESGGHRPGYAVVALYDRDGSPGVAVSFPDDSPITTPKSWSEIFETTGSSFDYTEAEVLGYLQGAVPYNDDFYALKNFLSNMSDFDDYYYGHPCATQYGDEATIVCFSNPTFGGVVTVDVVAIPEPAAWVLFVGLAGSMLLWRRDLCG